MSITRSLIAAAAMASLAPLAGCQVTDAPAGRQVRIVDSGATFPRDPASIQSASITKDTLHLRVVHGGGLEEHDFALFAFEFMESNPVQVHVVLSHDAGNDRGEALLVKDLSFDLSPLREAHRRAYGVAGPIIVQLQEPGDGADRTIRLRYEP